MQKLAFLLLFGLFACSQPVVGQQKIDAAELEKMLKNEPTMQLIDIRTPVELAQTGHIDGAKNLDFKSADFSAQIEKLDKKRPVIVYCAAGGRSPRAAAILKKMGFENVFDYSGGMNDWLAKGRKTVK